MNNHTTVTEAVQAPVAPWFVATQWEVEPVAEMIDRTRSSDGRWLKVNCSLNAATFTQSSSNVAMASAFGVDADELFVGKRR